MALFTFAFLCVFQVINHFLNSFSLSLLNKFLSLIMLITHRLWRLCWSHRFGWLCWSCWACWRPQWPCCIMRLFVALSAFASHQSLSLSKDHFLNSFFLSSQKESLFEFFFKKWKSLSMTFTKKLCVPQGFYFHFQQLLLSILEQLSIYCSILGVSLSYIQLFRIWTFLQCLFQGFSFLSLLGFASLKCWDLFQDT